MTIWAGGNQPASDVQGLRQRKLVPDQEKASHGDFCATRENQVCPLACLKVIRNAAIWLLQISSDPNEDLSFVGPQWAESWLHR